MSSSMRSSKRTPGVSGDRRDIIDDLNRLMAEEAEASLRYFQMRFRLRGKDYAAAERFFEEAIKETMEHANAIAQQIRSLGQIPILRINLSLGGDPMRLEAALAEALDLDPDRAQVRMPEDNVEAVVASENVHIGTVWFVAK